MSIERNNQSALEAIIDEKQSYPLVDRWVAEIKNIHPIREKITNCIDADDSQSLITMGFPQELIPIMRLWRKQGPDVLCTFAHPEEIDIYKIVALFNTKLFQEKALSEGINCEKILVNYYDTVDMHRSAAKPLQMAQLGANDDILGVAGCKSFQSIYQFQLEERHSSVQTTAIAETLINQLRGAVQPYIKTLHTKSVRIGKNEIIGEMTKNVQTRLRMLLQIADHTLAFCGNPCKVSDFLMRFQRNCAAEIFNGSSLEERFGFETELFSAHSVFLSLVRESIRILIEQKGLSVLKNIIGPGQGLALVIESDGQKKLLTKDAEDNFSLVNSAREAQTISENEACEHISKAIPLGKLENLALIAGGYTLHMGSEYQTRENIVKTLGIAKEAYVYCMKLRVGEDKEQGSECVMINNDNSRQKSSVYPSLLLTFVLFGKSGVKKLIAQYVGKVSEPQYLTMQQFKDFSASQLFDEAYHNIACLTLTPYG